MKTRFAVIVFLFVGTSTLAQQIRLVKDTDGRSTTPGDSWQITVANEMMFFVVDDGVHGEELWKSDGTDDGTMMVKNITPLALSSFPKALTPVGNLLFFTAWDGVETGRELWKSDGTEAGTVMVKDFLSGDQNAGPEYLTEFNGILYFLASNGTTGYELWRSDGSVAGTYRVKETAHGWDGTYGLVKGGNKLFFYGFSPDHGYELWTSDGTEAGTHEVKDIFPGTSSGVRFEGEINKLIGHNYGVYFIANDNAHGRELWKSDGTEVGTMLVKDFFPGLNPNGVSINDAVTIGNKMYFRFGGAELWTTQGTPATTTLTKIIMGAGDGLPQNFTRFGNKILFTAQTNPTGGADLWITDGSEDGTNLLRHLNESSSASIFNIRESNGKGYFTVEGDEQFGTEPWTTDGTPAGTVRLFDLVTGSGSSGANDYISYKGETFFTAENETFGRELFRENGTIVKDIHVRTQPGIPFPVFAFQGNVFFHDFWGQFWKSDGSEEGTDTVKAHLFAYREESAELNGKMYFIGGESTFERALYVTDGTFEGTQIVVDLLSSSSVLIKHKGFLYFFKGRDLYKSDGTKVGTQLLKTIDDDPGALVSCGDFVYFSAGELWRSNGTAAGTVIVKHIVSPPISSEPFHLTAAPNGMLYFNVETSQIGVQQGIELWRTDGSEAGTFRLKSFLRSASWQSHVSMEVVNNELFFSALSGEDGHVLWKSNGTEAGTVIVADVDPASRVEIPWTLTNVGGILYFTLHVGSSDELWKSDGTAGGTVLVKKWVDAHGISSLMDHHGELFFISSNVSNGWGIGKSDGTSAGTIIYYPQEPGGGITNMLPVDDQIFFVYESFRYGTELYVLETDAGTLCRNFSVKEMHGTERACSGSAITLTAVMEAENSPLTFRWFNNDVEIPGKTTQILEIQEADLSDAGIYKVVVSDGVCSTEANKLKVTVKDVPEMTELAELKVCSGEAIDVTLSNSQEIYSEGYNIVGITIPAGVVAEGGNASPFPETIVASDVLKYDRYTNNTMVPAVVQYMIRPVSMMGCSGGNVPFSFEIQPYPIKKQPESQTICQGTTLTLSVETVGTGTYQWKKQDVAIPGFTASTLILNNVNLNHSGPYTVTYNNGLCPVTSDMANVSVLSKPSITTQPQDVNVEAGALIELWVEALGHENVYVWKKNNVDLGAESSETYIKPDATTGDNGNYQVVVSNNCGSATSTLASVTVIPNPVLTVESVFNDFFATAFQSSNSQSYSVSGINLQGQIDIEIDEPFEIANNLAGTYGAALSLMPVSGTVDRTTLYIRFAPTEATTYEGYVRHYTLPAHMIEIPLKGFGSLVANENNPEDLATGIYPNPVQHKLHVEFKQPLHGESNLVIYTLDGQRTYQSTLNNVQTGDVLVVDTREWNAGGYVVMVTNANRKIIKKKIMKVK